MSPVLRLALRDMVHEPAHVFCIVALIAGVIAPLMLLLAVKTGVMETLIGALRENPNMRRVDIIGNHNFGESHLAALRSWPELAFAAPEERSIARRLEVRPPGARGYERMTLVSSADGDPLLPPGAVLAPGEVAVSATLAAQFGLEPGAVLEARATRGQPPTARLAVRLRVAHILPRGWLEGRAALAPFPFVSEVEAFYDDYALPRYHVPEGRDIADRDVRFESFRVFASDIRDVAALETKLEQALGVTVASRVGEIEPLLRLDRDVDQALNILAVSAAVGLAGALTALFWASVERKRLTLSMLALMGAPPRQLALFPLVQATLYALGGALAATVIFLAGAAAFETLLADDLAGSGARIAPVQPLTLLLVVLALLVLALAAAAVAARRAFTVDPAAVIRAGG